MNKTISDIRRWLDKNGKIHIFLIIVLIILCLIELRVIFTQIQMTPHRQGGYLSYQNGRIVHISGTPTPLDIQSWMTFHYVNFLFKLPENYLKSTLNISDTQYPNIQIDWYAKTHTINSTLFTQEIQNAVATHKL